MLSTHTQQSLLSRIRHEQDVSVAFKVGGVDALVAMDNVQAHDETTEGSGSGSGYSDITALENETDEFGRRLLQHQRDERRLNNAIRPGQQAFRKARPKPRLVDRLEQAGHMNGVGDDQPHERTGSGGSNDSEPPLNLPRQWGSKAKPRSEWLRKLHGSTVEDVPVVDSESATEAPRRDDDAIIPHRTVYTGDEDWVAVGEEALASIETTPPSMRRHSRVVSTPSSMHHMNSTIGDDLEADDQDFTAASLLASTPAVNRRNRKIDELTRREIESISKRGVTKRTLEQILEQSASKANEPRPVTAPSDDADPRQPRRRRSLIANKENLPPNGGVNGTFKGSETVGLVQRTAEAVTFKKAQRPTHTRTDSYHLLKKLARVSSLSPSPAKGRAETEVVTIRTKSVPEVEVGPLSAKSVNSEYIAVSRPHTSAGEELGSREHAARPEAPRRLDTDDEPDVPDIDVTPAPEPLQEGKTPVVTGAWVETPGPGLDVRPLLLSTDSTMIRAFGSPSALASLEPNDDPLGNPPRRIFSEPVHAKSALADVLKEAKAHPGNQLGEATIQSLEDIVNPDTDPTDTTMTIDLEQQPDDDEEVVDDGAPVTQAEKDRRQEKLAMEAMNKHLRAATANLSDANRGLRRVENKIETAHIVDSTTSITPSSYRATNTPPSPAAHNSATCPTCGRSAWRGLWTELLSCFFKRQQKRLRPTWLGLTVLSWLLWLLVENVLCSYYCHPLYASRMVGFGVDYDAPVFPLVIPTLLFRPLRPVWRPVSRYVYWGAGVLGNAVLGNGEVTEPVPMGFGYGRASGSAGGKVFASTGVRGSGTGWVRTASAALASGTARVLHSAVEAVDEVGSMWDDEFMP